MTNKFSNEGVERMVNMWQVECARAKKCLHCSDDEAPPLDRPSSVREASPFFACDSDGVVRFIKPESTHSIADTEEMASATQAKCVRTRRLAGSSPKDWDAYRSKSDYGQTRRNAALFDDSE